jgi:copper resistance protein D
MRGLYLASVWMHVLAAMTWTGGMVAFVVLVMPFFRTRPDAERAEFLAWFGPRFETVSWICLAILAGTGTFNLWARGVQPSDFLRADWRSTAFGATMTWKLVLVAAVTALSATHVRTHSKAQARWLGRLLLVISLAIVALAVTLVRAI